MISWRREPEVIASSPPAELASQGQSCAQPLELGIETLPAHARHRLPRLTARVFLDLGLWMSGFGVVIGLVFPPMVSLLGVPARYVYRPQFFAATVAAGLLVGGANFLLARLVVGGRLRLLTQRMRHVAEVLREATYSGDWSRCSPEACELAVDSADELGEAAESFNHLLRGLAGSRQIEEALGGYARMLASHLELEQLADAVLAGMIRHAEASAGALLVLTDGGLELQATHRIDGDGLVGSPYVAAAVRSTEIEVTELPHDLAIDTAVVAFRPAAVVVVPIRFKNVPVAVCVLATTATPTSDRIRLLDALRDTTGVALNNALAHDRFQRLAAVDPLTGAYNRRFGQGRLQEEFARSVRSGMPLGLLAFDLDHFKDVNDTFGHLVGDEVLRAVADASRLALRDGDVLIRSGGEEFLVLLPGAGVSDVKAIGERLRGCVAAVSVPTTADASVEVTVSVGGVAFPQTEAQRVEELIECADQALYVSKRGGRDRLTIHGDTPGAGTGTAAGVVSDGAPA